MRVTARRPRAALLAAARALLLVAPCLAAPCLWSCVRFVSMPAADGARASDGAAADRPRAISDAAPGAEGGASDGDVPIASEAGEPGPTGLYGPCTAGRCPADELSCVNGEISLCLRDCSGDPQLCAPDEECQLFGGDKAWCTPSCSGDDPCPGGMHCTGFGTFPVDHCHPNAPQGVGDPCSSAALCGEGLRCLGTLEAPSYCYAACPDPGDCSTEQRCVASRIFEVCLARCDPLAPSCPSHEYCWANVALGEGVCAPRPGATGQCGTSTPCGPDTVCADGTCRVLCQPGDTCNVGACRPVSGTPWNACQPVTG